jgi:uncharacterized protein (DUF433 family)
MIIHPEYARFQDHLVLETDPRFRIILYWTILAVLGGGAGCYSERGAQIMASLDWSQCPAVESVPGRVSGAWVFKDTRMPVSSVFENFESGATIEEIMEWFDVTREQVIAVLEFAARSLDAPARDGALTPVDAHSF